MTYHMLGDYERELAVSGHPAALAALGRVREAEQEAIRALPAQHTGDDSWPAPMGSECVAPEPRRTGIWKPRDGYGSGSSRGTGRRSTMRPGTTIRAGRVVLSVFYYRTLERGLERATSTAREGQHQCQSARRAGCDRRSDRRQGRSGPDGGMARRPRGPSRATAAPGMAALRGDRQRAVDLIRQAFEEQLGNRMFLHLDPEFRSLHDFPPYREPDGAGDLVSTRARLVAASFHAGVGVLPLSGRLELRAQPRRPFRVGLAPTRARFVEAPVLVTNTRNGERWRAVSGQPVGAISWSTCRSVGPTRSKCRRSGSSRPA